MPARKSPTPTSRRSRPPRPLFRAGLFAVAGLFALTPLSAAAQAFGGAVLVAGGRVLVGEAAHEREPGAVRAYALKAGNWTEVATLRGPGASVRDAFGTSLARAGDLLFIGAGRRDEGRVHIYRLADLDGTDPAPVRTLRLDGWSGLGGALAATETELVATATNPDGKQTLVTFRPDTEGMWSHAGTIAVGQGGGPAGVQFAVSGELLAVADPRPPGVEVYERGSGGDWGSPAKLEPSGADGEPPTLFGTAIAAHGDEILVGEMRIDRSGTGAPVRTGRVHRFAKVEGSWTAAGTLSPGDGRDAAGYGSSLAVHDNTLLVGGDGRVFVYAREAGGWTVSGIIPPAGAADEKSSLSFRTVALGDGIVALGDPAADFGMGAVTVLTRDPGEWSRSARLVAGHAPLPAVAGGEVACEDGEAVGYTCDHVDLLSFLPREELGAGRGARLNDVWGWTDSVTGREYGLVGRMDGTAFVDVTDPYNPRYLGNLATTEGSRANTWRDIKVFRDHAFIVADGAGAHGMQVFDLTLLRDVTEPREFESTALYTDIGSVHNVAINTETGFAYLVGSSSGGETCGGGSHMVDINDPANPVFAGCFAHVNTGRRNTGNTHDTQCVIYHGPDEDYRGREICLNSNETALSVADVTDKDNPVAVAKADYPNVVYAHQGWLTDDHRYFYSNDELDELQGRVEATRTLIWDLEDLDDPVLVREYFSPTKVTDHNLYIRGDRLYMSNNRAGLRVLDISDPENPVEVGYFDTTPWSADESGFDGTWSVYPYFESGTVLLSSRREGLFLVRPRARRLIP